MISSIQVHVLSTDHTAGGEDETHIDRKVDPVEDDSEATEDEEVKVNCIGGFSGIQDSDMSSDDERSDEESVPSEENLEDGTIPDEARYELFNTPTQDNLRVNELILTSPYHLW
jgi:hypothetical protein